MLPAQELVALMGGPAEPALDRALLLVAAARPGGAAPMNESLEFLDRAAAGCSEATITALTSRVFDQLGFGSDHNDYHDPRNSLFDHVLERRVGMPITLGALLLEVGRRLDLNLAGVGMPGHFLVADLDRPRTYLDPFERGAILDVDDCARRFRQLHGPDARFDPQFLQAIPNRAIVTRVLNNLTISYHSRDSRQLDWLLDLRIALPAPPPELYNLAALCEARGRFGDAARLLDRVAESTQSESALRQARQLRARLN